VNITLDDVYDWIHYAYYSVKPQVIINGFVKAGFVDNEIKVAEEG